MQKNNFIGYLGKAKKVIGLFEAVALILSGTIGAGILGIPYAISKVGLVPGIIYIFVIGLLMMILHLALGEITLIAKQNLQLSGLARKYLGRTGGYFMSFLGYSISFGVLVVYIIGVGTSLQSLFGGNDFFWSLIFFVVASIFVILGLKTIKKIDLLMVLGILGTVIFICALSVSKFNFEHLAFYDFKNIFFPYGVLLFAFHGAGSVPEAHFLLKNNKKQFGKAIVISSMIAIFVYIIFALAVVGVTGSITTEIATIGLGQKLGSIVLALGNIFAVLAMGTGFLMVGVSFKDSLVWDYKLPIKNATLIVLLVPMIIFLAGMRKFTTMLDIVGGIFGSMELLLILLIYQKVRKQEKSKNRIIFLHHAYSLVIIMSIAFSLGAVYSLLKII